MTITRILNHPITILLLTIAAITFFFSLDKSGKKTQDSSQNIQILEEQVSQLSNEVIELEEKVLESESQQFQEKVVRNELLMQKPGEYVLQITSETEDVEENCETNDCKINADESQKSAISAWIELLF